MARPGRDRQGGPGPGNPRQDHHGDRLLPAQHTTLRGTLQPGCPLTLGVETRLHWRLDVAMNEDQDATKGSLCGKLKRAGWDDAYLARLLALF